MKHISGHCDSPDDPLVRELAIENVADEPQRAGYRADMAHLLSLNLGTESRNEHAGIGVSGIGKRPVAKPVQVAAPGAKGVGGSGLIGDDVCDRRHHGGDDQAVYAYAREDLDEWSRRLARRVGAGLFGENLTTTGVEVTGALIGERWQIGSAVVLEVCGPRIPCRTFAGTMGERGWVKTFVARAAPGAYLRVVKPGAIQVGDPITVVHRPDHDVSVGLTFRALTTDADLLPALLAAPALPEETKAVARQRLSTAPYADLA